jgi:hypothetical protein
MIGENNNKKKKIGEMKKKKNNEELSLLQTRKNPRDSRRIYNSCGLKHRE